MWKELTMEVYVLSYNKKTRVNEQKNIISLGLALF